MSGLTEAQRESFARLLLEGRSRVVETIREKLVAEMDVIGRPELALRLLDLIPRNLGPEEREAELRAMLDWIDERADAPEGLRALREDCIRSAVEERWVQHVTGGSFAWRAAATWRFDVLRRLQVKKAAGT